MRLAGPPAPAWPAAAGALALAVAAALVLWLAPQWRDEAETRLAQWSSSTRAPELPAQPQPRLEKAAPAWPAPAASPRRAAMLSALARREGLELLQLREQLDAASQLQLGMIGRASYPALRQFVERALAADRALVLDRLRLHRGEADDLLVDFELQWTLLHRAGAALPAKAAANAPGGTAVNAAANLVPGP